MDLRKDFLLPLAWRAAVSAVPFSAAWWLLSRITDPGEFGPAILAATLLALPGFILAPPIARLLSDWTGHLYFPGATNDKPPPSYSLPRARRIQGKFEESLTLYEEIVKEHPQEVQAYLDMMDIASDDLKDLVRARSIGRSAVSVLRSPRHRGMVRRRLREGRG